MAHAQNQKDATDTLKPYTKKIVFYTKCMLAVHIIGGMAYLLDMVSNKKFANTTFKPQCCDMCSQQLSPGFIFYRAYKERIPKNSNDSLMDIAANIMVSQPAFKEDALSELRMRQMFNPNAPGAYNKPKILCDTCHSILYQTIRYYYSSTGTEFKKNVSTIINNRDRNGQWITKRGAIFNGTSPNPSASDHQKLENHLVQIQERGFPVRFKSNRSMVIINDVGARYGHLIRPPQQ